jgi:hypothetical protein
VREQRQGVGPLLELTALTSLSVAAPLLDVLGRAPDFFLFRGAGAAVVMVWAVVVVCGPPLALWGAELLAGRVGGPSARRAFHLASTLALFVVVALVVLKATTGLRGTPLLGAASLLGVGGRLLVTRFSPVRQWLRLASVAALVSLLVLLLVSPTSSLVLPGGGGVEALAADEARPPVVLIVFDEFPLQSLLRSGGEVDGRFFPNFARLASTSTFYRNATSVSARTPFAISSILTGKVPDRGRVPHVSQHPENLFTWLASSHDLRVFESITALCPRAACRHRDDPSLQASLRRVTVDSARVWKRIVALHDVEEDPAAWVQEHAERRRMDELAEHSEPPPEGADAWFMVDRAWENQSARLTPFLGSIDGEGRPLHFLHLVLPHSPWRYTPVGNTYEPQRLGYHQGEERDGQLWPSLVEHQRHLLQVAYVDRLLGSILDRLEKVDLFDRSLVMVTADHGIDFDPKPGGSERHVDADDADGIMWVPLFVKTPGQREAVLDERNATLVDVMPTVADVLGAELPWKADGRSLFGDERTDDAKVWANTVGANASIAGGRFYPRVLKGATDTLLRPEDGIDGMYRLGPYGDLVFGPVADMTRGPDSGWTARIDQLPALATVDFGRPVPALLTGQVDAPGAPPSGTTVAVAVNGTIGGVSELFAHGGVPRKFAVMVPDRLLKQGRNSVELFGVTRTDARVELRPIRLAS